MNNSKLSLQNGNFADVPANADSPYPRPQNISSFSRSPSPDFDFGNDPIFCRKCQANQHIYQQSLAEYLPDFDDPRYLEFEKALPEFKKNLGLRYPQVCFDCAPKAEKRLDRALYVAKADNARHMLRKSKQNERNIMALGLLNWRSIVIFTAGLLWWISILGQLIWHVTEVSLESFDDSSNRRNLYTQSSVEQCMKEVIIHDLANIFKLIRISHPRSTSATNPYCGLVLNGAAKSALKLGLLSFWWNNCLRAKIVDRRLGRMKGLGEYYQMQVLVSLVRWWALQYLDHPRSTGLTSKAFRGGHVVMLILFAFTTYKSCRLVYLDRSTRLNFNKQRRPLVDESQLQSEEDSSNLVATPSSSTRRYVDPYHSEVREQRRREERDRVQAAVRMRQQAEQSPLTPYNRVSTSLSRDPYNPSPVTPLTPPPEDDSLTTPSDSYDSENAMEWTPTQAQFQPRRPVQPFLASGSQQQQSPAPVLDYKSPFRGTLPPAPLPPAFRLRNPPQLSFHRPSEEKRNLFQDAVMRRSGADEQSGVGNSSSTRQGDEDGTRDMQLRPSKWFLESDYVDTGLETAFASVFSLDDTPKEVRAGEKRGILGGLFGRS
ncbi:MAG: hypothetical protein Q9165_000682 [Trypethelium subeluteriae]